MSFGQLFDPISIDDQHFLLASHTPPGRFWEKAFDKDDPLGKLFYALAIEFYRYQVLEKKFFTELDINKTDELLIDWEKSVILPDQCFGTNISQEKRREQVYAKFSKFGGVQKSEDFVRVAALFGFDITVVPQGIIGVFPLSFPLRFYESKKEATHTIFIVLLGEVSSSAENTFPLPFPINFGTGSSYFFQCIFEELAPANVKIVIMTEEEYNEKYI